MRTEEYMKGDFHMRVVATRFMLNSTLELDWGSGDREREVDRDETDNK